MFAELRKVDRNLVPCPFSTSVSIHCMEKNYSFLQLCRVRFTSWAATRDILQISKCWEMDIAAHALPEANNAVLLDASNSGFSWAVCRFCRRIWGVDILKWTCWREEHLGVDTNATAFTAFTAFHEFARANTSEFHFHGSSWFQVNLRAERVSLQCMCYTQSPKYVQSLPVQRRVWYCGIFLRKKRPIGSLNSLAHLIIVNNLMPHMKDGKNIQKPVLSLEQSRWVVKSDLDVGFEPWPNC